MFAHFLPHDRLDLQSIDEENIETYCEEKKKKKRKSHSFVWTERFIHCIRRSKTERREKKNDSIFNFVVVAVSSALSFGRVVREISGFVVDRRRSL